MKGTVWPVCWIILWKYVMVALTFSGIPNLSIFHPPTFGTLLPKDPVVAEGQNLTLTCKLDLSLLKKGINATRIFFTFASIPLDCLDISDVSHSVEVVSESTALLTVLSIPVGKTGRYNARCNVNQTNRRITQGTAQEVTVEGQPDVPKNVDCIFYNRAVLNCTWDRGRATGGSTNWTLLWTMDPDASLLPCQQLTVSMDSCTWVEEQTVAQIQSGTTMLVQVIAHNSFWIKKTRKILVDPDKLVKPEPVLEIIVQANASSVLLSWSAPQYSEEHLVQWWNGTDCLKNLTAIGNGSISMRISGLSPGSDFLISIKSKPKIAGFWSDPVYKVVRTEWDNSSTDVGAMLAESQGTGGVPVSSVVLVTALTLTVVILLAAILVLRKICRYLNKKIDIIMPPETIEKKFHTDTINEDISKRIEIGYGSVDSGFQSSSHDDRDSSSIEVSAEVEDTVTTVIQNNSFRSNHSDCIVIGEIVTNVPSSDSRQFLLGDPIATGEIVVNVSSSDSRLYPLRDTIAIGKVVTNLTSNSSAHGSQGSHYFTSLASSAPHNFPKDEDAASSREVFHEELSCESVHDKTSPLRHIVLDKIVDTNSCNIRALEEEHNSNLHITLTTDSPSVRQELDESFERKFQDTNGLFGPHEDHIDGETNTYNDEDNTHESSASCVSDGYKGWIVKMKDGGKTESSTGSSGFDLSSFESHRGEIFHSEPQRDDAHFFDLAGSDVLQFEANTSDTLHFGPHKNDAHMEPYGNDELSFEPQRNNALRIEPHRNDAAHIESHQNDAPHFEHKKNETRIQQDHDMCGKLQNFSSKVFAEHLLTENCGHSSLENQCHLKGECFCQAEEHHYDTLCDGAEAGPEEDGVKEAGLSCEMENTTNPEQLKMLQSHIKLPTKSKKLALESGKTKSLNQIRGPPLGYAKLCLSTTNGDVLSYSHNEEGDQIKGEELDWTGPPGYSEHLSVQLPPELLDIIHGASTNL